MKRMTMKLLLTLALAPVATAQFGPQQIITAQADGAFAVHAADLDGDGDLDVLAGSFWDDTLAWYENLGAGSFGAARVLSAQVDLPAGLDTADIDGDGNLDVLCSSGGNDRTLAWYRNLGLGSFGPANVISTNDWGASVYAADLDGDGDPDIVSGTLSPGYPSYGVVWYENQGLGAFAVHSLTPGGVWWPEDVHAADLDGDGDLDVLSAIYSGLDDYVGLYENLGNGNFGTEIAIPHFRVDRVVAGDLDGDGDNDIVASGKSLFGQILAYENLGNWSFVPSAVESTATLCSDICLDDPDLDGDLDVLAVYLSGELVWIENEGSFAWGPGEIISTALDDGASVDSADLDGDGRPDAISASYSDDKIAWYENLHVPPPPPMLGSGEDLTLTVQVNGVAVPLTPPGALLAGDLAALELVSPGGTFDWSPPIFLFQLHAGGLAPDPFFPYIHANSTQPGLFLVLVGGGPLGMALLPPGGITVGYKVPAGLAGQTLRVQALAASTLASTGMYASTDAFDLVLQ